MHGQCRSTQQRRVFIATSSSNRIGGTSPAERNVISGNLATGINISNSLATGNEVLGNFIGITAAGTAALGNGQFGVYVSDAPGNIVGGSAPGAGNVISSNGVDGVRLSGTATGNQISATGSAPTPQAPAPLAMASRAFRLRRRQRREWKPDLGQWLAGLRLFGHRTVVDGNSIGTNAAGTGAIQNLVGVACSISDPANHTIRNNVISGNAYIGMWLTNADHFTITGNKIGTTANGGSALPNGSPGYAACGLEVDGCIGTRWRHGARQRKPDLGQPGRRSPASDVWQLRPG